MVAEKVTVVTRKAGESQAVRWESTGDGSYSIEDCEKEKRGTTITITLAKDFYGDKAEENFTENYKLESLVKKYSDYVRYPIKMNFVVEETPKDADGKPIADAEKIKRNELRTLNSMMDAPVIKVIPIRFIRINRIVGTGYINTVPTFICQFFVICNDISIA